MPRPKPEPRPRRHMEAPWPHGRGDLRLMNRYEAQRWNAPEVHEKSWTFEYDNALTIRCDGRGDTVSVSCNHRGEPELEALLRAVVVAEGDALLLRKAYEALKAHDAKERGDE